MNRQYVTHKHVIVVCNVKQMGAYVSFSCGRWLDSGFTYCIEGEKEGCFWRKNVYMESSRPTSGGEYTYIGIVREENLH